jgi:hypothetical protein
MRKLWVWSEVGRRLKICPLISPNSVFPVSWLCVLFPVENCNKKIIFTGTPFYLCYTDSVFPALSRDSLFFIINSKWSNVHTKVSIFKLFIVNCSQKCSCFVHPFLQTKTTNTCSFIIQSEPHSKLHVKLTQFLWLVKDLTIAKKLFCLFSLTL